MEEKTIDGRNMWAHIVRGQAFQFYPKPKNKAEKARINAIVNTILEYIITQIL